MIPWRHSLLLQIAWILIRNIETGAAQIKGSSIGLTASTNCSAAEFLCDNSKCIPKEFVCDGVIDCPKDLSDEQPEICAIIGNRPCTIVEFRCNNGKCIPLQLICDGQNHCRDGSDEVGNINCTNPCDPTTEFHCPANTRNNSCYPLSKRCDGILDCIDGRDEVDCVSVNDSLCSKDHFRCPDGRCLSSLEDCGFMDCGNATEVDCRANPRCSFVAGRCREKEKAVELPTDANVSTCQYPNRWCNASASVKECVTISSFCDKKNDCLAGRDEGPGCDMGQCLPNPCINGTCHALPDGSFACLCPTRFSPSTVDNKICTKTDRCTGSWGLCSQICVNSEDTIGYRCECYVGFQLAEDYFSCHSRDNQSAQLIFSSRHEIRMIDLSQPHIQPILVPSLRNTIAIDFLQDAGEYGKQLVFWTDVVDDKIYSGSLVDTGVFNIKHVVENSLPTAEGIAVDWIGWNLYWVESTLDQIEVSRLDGQLRSTVVAGNMTNPRAIVLDPEEGLLFWTDWDPDYPRIESCTMAGEERKVLVNISAVKGGKWPNGLAIDFTPSPHRLYWIDAYSDAIETVTIYGNDLREVLRGGDFLQHPFAVAIYDAHVYWTDWRTNSVHKANKWNGSDVTTVVQVSTQPFDLHIMHPSVQPKVRNPCGSGNAGCSSLCLIGRNGTRQCACPHLFQLAAGSTTQCEPFRTFMLFSRTTEIRGVTLDKAHHNFIPAVMNVQNATTMDIDVRRENVYWVDAKAKAVMRANLNGSSTETVIDSPGGPRPTDISIDWISGNIFIAFASDGTSAPGEIVVSTLSGEFRKAIMTTEIITPVSIVVNPVLGVVAWSDIGHSKHRIELSNTNGRSRTVAVDASTTPHFRTPRSLTFGYGSQYQSYLFWISEGYEKIQYCEIDLKAKFPCASVQTIDSKDATSPFAIAFYDGQLLIAAGHIDPAIGLFNLQNSSYSLVRTNTPSVVSLKMYSPSVQAGTNACSVRNGNCSQLCLPTPDMSRTCNCTAGFVLNPVDELSCLPLNSTLLYSSGSQIHGIAMDPAQTEELLPRISRIQMATALDFDAESSFVFWVDPKSSSLNRIRRDLTGRQIIVEDDMTSVENIAVDWMAGNIFWTNPTGKTIEVARLNGSSRYVLLHENIESPKAIAVHPGKGFVFWSDYGGLSKTGRIERVSLDSMERTVLREVQRVVDITIDYDEDKVYWCDSGSDKIERANLDFSNRTVLLSASKFLMDPGSLVVFLEHLYWSDRFPQRGIIYRADKSILRTPTVIRKSLEAPVNDLAVFSKQRQKGKNLCSEQNGGCEELCFYGNRSRRCACAHGVLSADGTSCDVHTSFLLYSRGRSVESAHLLLDSDKNTPIAKLNNSTAMVNVIGLAFDYATSRVFYSDIQKGEILSVLFNGTEYRTVAAGVGSAEGLAFDPIRQELYWTSYNNASLFRIFAGSRSASQTAYRVLQLDPGDKLRNLALDACAQKLYWTNWNKDHPCIQRAGFDGTKLETIISTDIKTPNAVTIDHRSQYLFWADALLDKIERARFDGSERKILLWDSVRHPFALAVHGDHIFWTDWILRAIVRANKYTGLDVTKIKENLGRQPMGIIAVSNTSQDCTLNPCYKSHGGCSEICLPSEDGRGTTCRCFNNRKLLADGHNCEPGLVGPGCAKDNFRCTDGECVSETLRCNKRNDCRDGSDEIGCTCNENEFRCKSNGQCIKSEYRCDGEQDCGDFSDEVGCHGRKCETTPDGREMLPCPNSAMCFLPEWKCDGDNDCGDWSDETNCTNLEKTTPLPCSSDSFRCLNGHGCIPKIWVCDGELDCADSSDETACARKCPLESFQCSDGSCIPSSWKCDGSPECEGGEDEAIELCQKTNCSQSDFRCRISGLCIPGDWRCDGEVDCGPGDQSDEIDSCESISRCSFNEFRCKNNRCIPKEFVLDKDDDCGDNSDEMFPDNGNEPWNLKNITEDNKLPKPVNSTCPSASFRCKNGKCLEDDSLLCNNNDDCGDLSDETMCDIRDCASNPCGPYGKCVEKSIGHSCKCDHGYTISNTSGECVDYNECADFPCSHFCYNTIGSYRCVCAIGYSPLSGGQSCKANTNIQPTLIYSNKHFIRNVSFSGNQKGVVRGNLTNAVALDFEWSTQCVFWSDVTLSGSSINKWCSADPVEKVHILHSTTVHNPDGIAVDWIGKNLYWCDKGTDTIEVSRLDGGSRKILLREGLQEARAIVVDPHHGYLYWTDWGTTPHIGKMGLDGSNVFRLELDRSELGWPNALAIDYVTNTVFWADAKLDYIAMADLNLQHRRHITQNSHERPEHLRHVFAMTVFEDYLFWTDWETKQIHKANKFSGMELAHVQEAASHRPMDIQVFHPYRQTPLSYPNPCTRNSTAQCGNLCLLRPTNSSRMPVTSVCACPENFVLDTDGRTCQPNCSTAHFVCKNTFKCIPKWWQCDKQDDCGDGEDELGCTRNFTCLPGEFQCTNVTGKCLHPTSICNGVRECADGSDETFIDCSSYSCLANQFKCPQSNRCIPRSQVCDGKLDCPHSEDERNCSNIPFNEPAIRNCSAGRCEDVPEKCDLATHFQCNNSQCISQKWVCDEEEDCADGSDENQQMCGIPCGPTEFACGDRCLDMKFRCDGEPNCDDGSDEANCTTVCPIGYSPCADNSSCIPDKFLCDGVFDCRDSSDEAHCEHACAADEFTCKNKHCVPRTWLCDGQDDCGDKTDEQADFCAPIPCAADRFRCGSGACILQSQRCDKRQDCADGSDEKNCEPNCAFRCTNGRCLTTLKDVCNNVDNCGDNSDEHSCNLNPCERYGYCSQRCTWDGDADRFTCACDSNYRLEQHGRSNLMHVAYVACVADGAPATLLIAEQNQLRSLDPYHRRGEYRQLMELKDDRINFVDVNFRNPSDGTLYWSSRENHVIYKQSLPKKRKERGDFDRSEPVPLISKVQDPRGVAVDWINERLFWIDGHTKLIEMAYLNGSSRTAVVKTGLADPYDIRVDPESGYIFWTDISGSPRIERAKYDGTNRKVLVNRNIRYPTGLAIDYANRRIYWADPKTAAIESVTIDGKDRQRVTHSSLDKERPYKIDIFEDQIFFSTSKNKTILRINKFGTGNATVLAKGLRRPANILILQEQKQNRKLPNLCAEAACQSDMICIPDPPNKHHCMCSGYKVFDPVLKKCRSVDKSKCEPPCQNGGECRPLMIGSGYGCKCRDQYQGPTCSVEKCSTYCYNNGICSFTNGTAQCTCSPPFTGERCHKNLCANFCQHGGNCSVDPKGLLSCSCPPDWMGRRCDIPRRECNDFCKNSGSCYVQEGKANCVCLPGFSGEHCEMGEGFCGRCHNNGTCYIDRKGAERCRCEPGFEGEKCEKCDDLKCHNNGVCSVSGGVKRCACSLGFTGSSCEDDLCEGYCKTGTCIHKAPPYNVQCFCPPGKTGLRCHLDDREHCSCRNNGTCVRGNAGCVCRDGFYGQSCEYVTSCSALKCTNGGKCVSDPHYNYRCECPSEWTGTLCELPIICRDFCKNGGTCLPLVGEHTTPTCMCPPEYLGLHCESHILDLEDENNAMSTAEATITIGIPITIIIVVLCVGSAGLVWRKRKQSKPFQHVLMEEVETEPDTDAAINNPMFLKDEMFEESDSDVLHPDRVAFANPVYESCFYEKNGKIRDSTEKSGLLQLHEDDVDSRRMNGNGSVKT